MKRRNIHCDIVLAVILFSGTRNKITSRNLLLDEIKEYKYPTFQSVICTFFNKSENTSILHHLAPTKNTDRPCSMRNHGCCRFELFF